jgi:hypothetical protein
LFDTRVLNKGLSEGRRIAKEFSRHVMTSAMPTTRSRKLTVANRTTGGGAGMHGATNIAAGRHFSKVMNIEKLDPRIRDEWNRLVLTNTVVHEDDIVRVLGVTYAEAQEMVWEADLLGRGTLQLFDLLDSITTVWEGEVRDEGEEGGNTGGGGERQLHISSAAQSTTTTPSSFARMGLYPASPPSDAFDIE